MPARAISCPRAEHRISVERSPAPPKYVGESSSVYQCETDAAAMPNVVLRRRRCEHGERDARRVLGCPRAENRVSVARQPVQISTRARANSTY